MSIVGKSFTEAQERWEREVRVLKHCDICETFNFKRNCNDPRRHKYIQKKKKERKQLQNDRDYRTAVSVAPPRVNTLLTPKGNFQYGMFGRMPVLFRLFLTKIFSIILTVLFHSFQDVCSVHAPAHVLQL